MRVAAIVLTGLVLATAASVAAAPAAPGLGGCTPQEAPRVRPDTVVLGCGDAGLVAHDLVWSSWGGAQAVATGTATIKTCDPDCATGGLVDREIRLTADRLRTCADGRPRYTRVLSEIPPGARPQPTAFPCPVPPPRLVSVGMRPRGSGSVVVRVRLCARSARALTIRLSGVLRERGRTVTSHHRLYAVPPRTPAVGCRTVVFRDLRPIGPGVYRVSVRVLDSGGGRSAARSAAVSA